ncbi:hypothetical protein X943_002360 [Babesia divergens]|uniref:Uncharacterized protein n=1 Tax=Babesia divergens TaxID=32595 RepID=A0AAD9LEA0_BABDI|nr:hypothetical protein X943_002360 [Babesia divergens]
MAAVSRRIGLKNEKFSTKIVQSNSAKKTTPRRSTSFYVLVQDYCTGDVLACVSVPRPSRLLYLWNTLVPERNWSPLTPQFWVLLAATLSLYCYNRRNADKVEDVISAEDHKRVEALSRIKPGESA